VVNINFLLLRCPLKLDHQTDSISQYNKFVLPITTKYLLKWYLNVTGISRKSRAVFLTIRNWFSITTVFGCCWGTPYFCPHFSFFLVLAIIFDLFCYSISWSPRTWWMHLLQHFCVWHAYKWWFWGNCFFPGGGNTTSFSANLACPSYYQHLKLSVLSNIFFSTYLCAAWFQELTLTRHSTNFINDLSIIAAEWREIYVIKIFSYEDTPPPSKSLPYIIYH